MKHRGHRSRDGRVRSTQTPDPFSKPFEFTQYASALSLGRDELDGVGAVDVRRQKKTHGPFSDPFLLPGVDLVRVNLGNRKTTPPRRFLQSLPEVPERQALLGLLVPHATELGWGFQNEELLPLAKMFGPAEE